MDWMQTNENMERVQIVKLATTTKGQRQQLQQQTQKGKWVCYDC